MESAADSPAEDRRAAPALALRRRSDARRAPDRGGGRHLPRLLQESRDGRDTRAAASSSRRVRAARAHRRHVPWRQDQPDGRPGRPARRPACAARDVDRRGRQGRRARGYCLMIGGEAEVVKHLDPIFSRLAPGAGDIARTPGRDAVDGTAERGYLHCGPNGAGHFVKMVHNGIEYGIMAAYAEGLGILRSPNIGKRGHAVDAETTPLRDPAHYQYDFNLPDIAEVWRRGSVVASWLLDLSASALIKDPELKGFQGRVSDSGEGRWTIKAAIDEAVPTPVLSSALCERFTSRGEADFQDRGLSAMRFEFGGQ